MRGQRARPVTEPPTQVRKSNFLFVRVVVFIVSVFGQGESFCISYAVKPAITRNDVSIWSRKRVVWILHILTGRALFFLN
jgi:hypothetical protein